MIFSKPFKKIKESLGFIKKDYIDCKVTFIDVIGTLIDGPRDFVQVTAPMTCDSEQHKNEVIMAAIEVLEQNIKVKSK